MIPSPVTYEEKIAMMKKHFKLLKEDKNATVALLEIRSNILFYLKGMPEGKIIKNKICNCQTEEEIMNVLDNYLDFLKKSYKS